jgi:hypothetical protein
VPPHPVVTKVVDAYMDAVAGGGPAAAGPVPHAHEGRFRVAPGRFSASGPTDPGVLAAWTAGNLDSYWRRWVDRIFPWASTFRLYVLTGHAMIWGHHRR